ncbi:MAG: helix-turn-helix domain-containing protein [Sporichthyaceae bacterium]
MAHTSTRIPLAEAAASRGVSTRTVRRWIAAGLLPAYRVGPRLVRINPEDLDKLDRRIPTAGSAA